MTPKRKAYLAKCSRRERFIRDYIAYYKQNLKIYKRAKRTNDGGEYWVRKQIRNTKFNLSAYRHELARLKGMERVTVPKLLTFLFSDGKRFEGFVCSHCGETLMRDSCVNCGCGRRILWNKTL